MGRTHIKRTDFYNIVIKKTDFFISGENIIIRSYDFKDKPINYSLKINFYNELCNRILDAAYIEGMIELKVAVELLYSVIFQTYKSKVATKRIPQLILNVCVLKGIMYTESGEDYILKIQKEKAIEKLIKRK
ncbi:MAG: hypothetical protein ACOCP8_00050 [archaeon]